MTCKSIIASFGVALILAVFSGTIAEARSHHRHHHHRGSVSLAGVVPELASKAQEIAASCGSTIVSARSKRGNKSNHPIGRAVDISDNPSCIYAHLQSWPGGVSTDYGRVGHVHISYNPGGQEWGLRFAHGGHRHSHARYASGIGGAPQLAAYGGFTDRHLVH